MLVRAALEAQGLETPLVTNELNSQQKREKIEGHMRSIMATLGLDLTDDSLAETPHRIAKMYVNEIFSGLDYSTFPKVTVIENKMQVDEMIMVRDISLTSTCEHHFVTIDGHGPCGLYPSWQGDWPVEDQPHRAVFFPAAPKCRSG